MEFPYLKFKLLAKDWLNKLLRKEAHHVMNSQSRSKKGFLFYSK